MADIPRPIRELVLARDNFSCVSCGNHVGGVLGYSIQHRIPRGMGGSKDPRLNMPSNLITLCGSATTGCHEWAESERDQSREWGYLLYRISEPSKVAVYTHSGWVLYADDGSIAYPPAPDVAPHQMAEVMADIERARLQRMGRAA